MNDFAKDHETETTDQVSSAINNLHRDDGDWINWPWPDLTALCGRMKPRDIWFVCGFSGNGKTLFVSSAIQGWIEQRVKVYVMPLETSADDFRLYLACQRVGIDPGLVNGGGMLDMDASLRTHWERLIQAELERQATDPAMRRYVRVKGVQAVNLERLTLAAKEAADWGASILVVDHIDHIEGTGKGGTLEESQKVTKASHLLAKKYNMTFVFTSQMNNESVKGRANDRLAQYGPPQPHHVYMGSHKRQIATGMLGLHRRVRDPLPGETPKEFAESIRKSRDGEVPPLEALEPGVMAVTAMKLRHAGQREGQRAHLGVNFGRVEHLPEKDRIGTSRGALRTL